ncbi:MAG: hypothetical protein ACLUD0_02805 [Eubacterium ramulus]
MVADPDGTPNEVIVSDWLKNHSGADNIEDVSDLKDIENVKGDETFTQGADGALTLAGRWKRHLLSGNNR